MYSDFEKLKFNFNVNYFYIIRYDFFIQNLLFRIAELGDGCLILKS